VILLIEVPRGGAAQAGSSSVDARAAPGVARVIGDARKTAIDGLAGGWQDSRLPGVRPLACNAQSPNDIQR
jgi:hypothetical protein